MPSLSRHALAFGLTVALAGCGDDGGSAGGGGAGNGSNSGGSSSGGQGAQGGAGGGADGVCSQAAINPSDVCVDQVTGTLVDESGAPVADMLTTVCGTISCNPGESDASGAFVVDVDAFIPLDDFSTHPHGREEGKSVFYFPLPTDATGPVVDMGDLLLLDMPTDGPNAIIEDDGMGAPAQSLTNNGVTLDIPDGVQLQLEFADALEDKKQYAARRVPDQLVTSFAPDDNLAVLYAFYPFEAAFRPEGSAVDFEKVQLSIPNDIGLAADTPVEFLAHGSFLFPDYVKPASFGVVATGRVSADGTRIEMDPGEGIEILTWVGVRPM